MEIPAILFFVFRSYFEVLFLYFGLSTLDNTDLPDSVPPVVMFVFKTFLVFAAFLSNTSYMCFLYVGAVRTGDLTIYYSFMILAFLVTVLRDFPHGVIELLYFPSISDDESFIRAITILASYPILLFTVPLTRRRYDVDSLFVFLRNNIVMFQSRRELTLLFAFQFHVAMHLCLLHILTRVPYFNSFIPVLLYCITKAANSGDERFQRWVPVELNRVLSELRRIVKKNGKVIEFSVGMVGSILFQYFFRLTTFNHVLGFLYLAVAWLANLALLPCPRDHGVFNFLLSNVMVGCTVSQFGVGWTTWFVYAASLLLYILRVQLKLICLVTRDDGEEVVTWRQNQTEETDRIV